MAFPLIKGRRVIVVALLLAVAGVNLAVVIYHRLERRRPGLAIGYYESGNRKISSGDP